MNDSTIEGVLRQAPRPKPPPALKQRLLDDIVLSKRSEECKSRPPFWRRWSPVLSLGCLLLACLVCVGAQTKRLIELKRQNVALRQSAASLADHRRTYDELVALRGKVAGAEKAQADFQELVSLRAELDTLRSQARLLEELQDQKTRLLEQRTGILKAFAAHKEEDPFAASGCVHKLKRVVLAARIWANDHGGDAMPPDFLSTSNELASPELLICPSDTNHVPARRWDQCGAANVTYELISPSVDTSDPQVVYVRCPIHNHMGMTDGSVQRVDPKVPLINVDGKTKIGWAR